MRKSVGSPERFSLIWIRNEDVRPDFVKARPVIKFITLQRCFLSKQTSDEHRTVFALIVTQLRRQKTYTAPPKTPECKSLAAHSTSMKK